MKNLVNKIKESAKNVGKVVAPVVIGGILSTSNVDAQTYKSSYKNHDIGGSFRKYEVNSQDILEEKVFYNPVTKTDDRFYINYLDKNGRKLYEDDLDIAGLAFEESNPMIELGSSEVDYIASKGIYHFREIQDFNKFVLEDTHVANRCPDQIILLANGINPTGMDVNKAKKLADTYRGENYISQSRVKDYDDSMPKTAVLKLGNGEEYFVYPLPKEQQEEGKTNQILIPMNNENYWTYDPVTKDIIIHGTFYRGIREGQPAMMTGESIKRLGTGRLEKSEYDEEIFDEANKESRKQDRKQNFYLIAGINSSAASLEENEPRQVNGELGIQYGPIALVGSYGTTKDAQISDIEREMNQGRIFYGEDFRTNAKKKGLNLEAHFFDEKTVSPFVGVGVNNFTYDLESKERTTNSEGILIESKDFNEKISEKNYNLNAGVDFKIGEKSKLGFNVKYEKNLAKDLKNNLDKGKFYGGVRFTRKIGRR